MSRPTLPSISQSTPQLPKVATSSNEIRSLPPLSALLNGPNKESESPQHQVEEQQSKPLLKQEHPSSPHSAPVSPTRQGSTDLFSHKITPASASATTTAHPLPTVKTPVRLPSFDSIKFENRPPQPVLHHSKSFNVVPQQIPTPTSQPQLLQAQGLAGHPNLVSPLVEKRSYAFISHSPSTFPSQEPAIDNAQLARRKRRRTSPLELSILQAEFEKGQTPNRTRRLDIAKRVNMTEKAIQIWFQNRRQTLRRQSNAEREIHHIEPIYHPQNGAGLPLQSSSTPIRQPQGMIYTTTPNVAPHQQYFPAQSSSPVKIDTTLPSNPPSASSQSSSPSSAQHSSPIHQQASFPVPPPQQQHQHQQPPQVPAQAPNQPAPNFLVTPARTPKTNVSTSKSPIGGSTLTFRLKNKPAPKIHIASDKTTTMTQVSHTSRTRQKPVMRVNPTPSKSSPIKSQKENISPDSSPIKTGAKAESTSPVRGGERIVLQELSFNKKGKPKKSGSDEDQCVANLLHLRNWK